MVGVGSRAIVTFGRNILAIPNRIAFSVHRLNYSKFSRASVYAARPSACTVNGLDVEVSADVQRIPKDIRNVLSSENHRVNNAACFTFSTQGKMVRPLLVLLMAVCANSHTNYSNFKKPRKQIRVSFPNRLLGDKVLCSQHAIAVISEMIHTASLVHDDLIDHADTRRGNLTTYKKIGSQKAILLGNMILVRASELLAKLEDPEVISVLSAVLDDLIRGEFMQLASSSDENHRFHLYLEKTYKKTASLMANSCKAATLLSDVEPRLVDSAFNFGRHLGMAFQLLDDVLDFTGQESKLGKPAGGSDLQLGLATGPALFAAQQFPDLEKILEIGVKSDDDRMKACSFIHRSNGIGQTRMLAEFHFQEAQRELGYFRACEARNCLLHLAGKTVQRSF